MAWTAPKTWTVGEMVTAANMNTHLRDNLNALGRDPYGVRVIGTAGGFGERWHVAGAITHQADGFGSTSLPIDTLHTIPFVSPRGGTLDRIGFSVATGGGAGSVARAGIYQATSDTDPYPSARIVDGGEFVTTSTGVKAATISVVLEPDILYWAVLLGGVAAPTVTNFFSTTWAGMSVLGMASTFATPHLSFTRLFTYAALPSTFPAGPPSTFVASAFVVGLRYSA